MKHILLYALFLFLPALQYAQNADTLIEHRITSEIDSSHENNLVLIQTFEVNAAVEKVWDAYATKNGWESWVTPNVEMDFRIGGLIKTNYDKNAAIGDPGTIILHVINYVPQKMITLQAELSENFPEFMKADAENMYNTILFEALSPSKTKVTSYGIGYKNNAQYRSLLDFFVKGNEMSYQNLITYLETGVGSLKY